MFIQFKRWCLLNHKAEREKNAEEGEADERKEAEEGEGFAFVMAGVGAEGDEAGEGGDEGTRAADVHAPEQAAVVLGEGGKENGGGHVADKLAGEGGHHQGIFGKEGGQKLFHRIYPGKVPCKHEKGAEGEQQTVVHLQEGFSV